MDQNTQQLIDNLFTRLQQAEKQGGSRDQEAQSLIDKHLIQQPSAPYYMAQTMVMQEATIKQLHARVEALETQLQQAQQHQSGGFLSGLFGGNRSQAQPSGFQNQKTGQPYGNAQQHAYGGQGYGGPAHGRQGYGGQAQYGQAGGFGRGNSFLGGALQTAAGVAGGVVLGNLMMDMFSHHHPQEVVNIINEEPSQSMNDGFTDQSDFGQNTSDQFADGGNNDFQDASFDNSDVNDADFASQGVDNGTFANDSGFADNSGFFDNSGFGDSGFDNSDFGGFDSGGFDDFGGGFDDFS
ncbi:hypothetical protein VA7868_03661 [Vibrio aerogenes CECT 7868]|uniref:Periplasmic ligand-binding sensor protein n=1 Tax=Vibrio aerogenes CECT 7868 TaxID=1216006 RepID=A0A1M6ATP7_9VIBR|nr:DUF2076 domain-containing protein [Vibrio aerogenes]SHI39688.1 hypothetical protein VA7868_03661 [Vibrio aerogenes CECT 7868]